MNTIFFNIGRPNIKPLLPLQVWFCPDYPIKNLGVSAGPPWMPPFLLKIKGFDKTNSRSYFVVYDALCTYFHIPSLPRFPLGARSPTFTRTPTPTPHLAGDSTLNFGTHMVSISHAFLTPDLRSMINTMIWGQFTFRPSRGGGWVSVLRTPGPLGEEDRRYRDIYYYLLRNYIA